MQGAQGEARGFREREARSLLSLVENVLSLSLTASARGGRARRKFLVRDFSFDPERAAQSQREMVELGVELQQLQLGLIRWCGTQFGEAFVAWMHVKVSERASESERERESVTLLSQETRALSLSDARPLVAFVARRARAAAASRSSARSSSRCCATGCRLTS